ncbi:PREDICTED: NADH dehydrogenase [ubiquinone] 1 alpha subcomplex subunit 7 [Ceratosolen solmsi marchali]|uniref:NADH dehydrogenase [ubiquinone] 1 alpha subcomplex subunit 7 n=1 Tax=Ceratosolen solmsi marchali TaxID=326594 RepID=A0AAJ6YQI8_9HYME|nr:PREDICTED: NADH dehydrogenase [ubiquinone] 1 alpha subcomplex subunit 7 [Ceratosolen solmsi marchali]
MSEFKLNRSISFFTYILHTACRSTPFVTHLRYPEKMAARTQPHPSIPVGPNNKMIEMYYFDRDAKRQVQLPTILFKSTRLMPGEDIQKLTYFTQNK